MDINDSHFDIGSGELNGEDKSLIEDIVYSGEDINMGISVILTDESKEKVAIHMMCCLLIDDVPIPFSIDGSEKGDSNYVDITNGIEKIFSVEFYPYGITDEYKELIFLGVPYYDKAETEVPEENLVIYCKKNIISEAGETDNIVINRSKDYFITENTVDTYGKELYEISEYNGSVKDFIIQKDDGSVYYVGDYKNSCGVTYFFDNGQFLTSDSRIYCLTWDNQEGRYINAKLELSNMSREKKYHICNYSKKGRYRISKKIF